MAIRCLIVDAQPLSRQGLRRMLENDPGIEVTGEAQNAAEAVECARQLQPNVVLMDIGLPFGFEASRRITRELPGRRVIFLTPREDDEHLVQCSEAGASGCILKDAPVPHLIDAVRDVGAGRKYFSPQALGKLVDDFRSRSSSGSGTTGGPSLTPREREVVKMLAEGHSVRQIAAILGLSMKTVEAHKFNLMRKLNIHNKAQLVMYAIQKKIVKMPAGA